LEVEIAGAPSDNTTAADVLACFEEDGYEAELWAKPGGHLLCGACRATNPAAAFTIGRERRLEGASDPDDMQLVVGATCPACGARGVLTLQYGPKASQDDADVVVALPR
jgi:Zn ribbon nucleic-acid-binding protein